MHTLELVAGALGIPGAALFGPMPAQIDTDRENDSFSGAGHLT